MNTNTVENGNIVENLSTVQQRIEEAAKKANRSPDEITLVAVSKRHSEESIRIAYAAGQRDFGENYAQELRDKATNLKDLTEIRWHFIGNLQRNKIKYVAPFVNLLETVDSFKFVGDLAAYAKKIEKKVSCLLQVNVGEEIQKSGCSTVEAAEIMGAIDKEEWLSLDGLMTIPPWDLDAQQTRTHFSALKKLQLENGGRDRLPILSMGMSHDFDVAIEEGATHVRVGTAIFGTRAPR